MYVIYFVPNYYYFFLFGLLFHTVLCVCVLVHLSDLDMFCLFSLVLISLAEDLSFNAFFIAF